MSPTKMPELFECALDTSLICLMSWIGTLSPSPCPHNVFRMVPLPDSTAFNQLMLLSNNTSSPDAIGHFFCPCCLSGVLTSEGSVCGLNLDWVSTSIRVRSVQPYRGQQYLRKTCNIGPLPLCSHCLGRPGRGWKSIFSGLKGFPWTCREHNASQPVQCKKSALSGRTFKRLPHQPINRENFIQIGECINRRCHPRPWPDWWLVGPKGD